MLLNNLGKFSIWREDFATVARKARRYGLKLEMLPDGTVRVTFRNGETAVFPFGTNPADAWADGDVRYIYVASVNAYNARKILTKAGYFNV